LRSTDLVRDFEDPNCLQDYCLTGFGRQCLEQIGSSFGLGATRRAWRLTGDFGSGKSSFALMLASALRAPNRLPKGLRDEVAKIFPASLRWKSFFPVLVVGTREPIRVSLVRSLAHSLSKIYTRGAKSALISQMEASIANNTLTDKLALSFLVDANAKLIQNGKANGILLILDEAGKYLEYAAIHPGQQDVFFLQQLAELASRSGKHPLVVLCLFHQGFNAYAEQLAKATQQEWDKIAGRYEEIAFQQPLDQIARLASAGLGAIDSDLPPKVSARARATMERAISLGWYGTSSSREMLRSEAAALFPIDPMLFPVLVRFFRRFGQNERSLFGFIFSHEPFGLQYFVADQELQPSSRPYQLADFYDYMRANFGHRLATATHRSHWNVIESTIEAYQPKPAYNGLDLRILKTVGVLNLLGVHEFVPTDEAIAWAVAGNCENEHDHIVDILIKTAKTPALYFKGKGRGYSIWSHTSVDIDARLEEARNLIPTAGSVAKAVEAMLPEAPVVARAHYIKTGNLRYFDVVYCQPDELVEKAQEHLSRADGFILIPLCESQIETQNAEKEAARIASRTDLIRLIAVPKPLTNLNQAVLDVQRWEWVQHNTPDLNNDPIARSEVQQYLQEARCRLQTQVQGYLGVNRYSGETSLTWFYDDHEGKYRGQSGGELTSRGVLELLSILCDVFYKKAPLIKNELVNRHNISSAATAARMRLIDLMFTAANQPELGMDPDKKPPEKSMYFSVLKKACLHRIVDDKWLIATPDDDEDSDPCHLRPVLLHIKKLLAQAPDVRIPIANIMRELRRPPYGVRDGLFPILIAVIAIEGEHEIAFYENGTFLREIGRDAFLRMTKAPEKFEVQLCRIEGVRASLFQQLAGALQLTSKGKTVELLDVVRDLCQFVARLPEYSRNTRRLKATALAVRDVILEAREPVKLVFHDLPTACNCPKFEIGKSVSASDAERFVKSLRAALDDIRDAFPNLQRRIEDAIASELGFEGQRLRQYRPKVAERAEKLMVRVTENKLKAFIFRLFDESLGEPDWLGSVGSVLALRPPDKWKDEDEDRFQRELEALAGQFKRAESAAFANGGGKGIRVAITQSDGTERQEVVQLDDEDEKTLTELQSQIMRVIKQNPRLGLAAASKAIWSQIKTLEDSECVV
jgi:hypothetical protein